MPVSRFIFSIDMPDRIAALLGAGSEPMPVNKIADMLYGHEEGKGKRASIRARLNQDRRFKNVSQGQTGAWVLADADTPEQEPLLEHEKAPADQWQGDIF